MTFASPQAFWLLLLLPLLFGVKVYGDHRTRRATSRMASPRLLAGLLARPGRRRAWVTLTLEAAAVACFITALARPQYGYLEEVSDSTGRSLIVAIDTSRSMLANDLQPDRLTRAKLAAIDLIKKLRGDRIGLMPFAGTAFMYAPITPDADALIESIDSLDHEIIPRGGSNLARPIDLALETFDKGKIGGQRVLILFSDGEELEGATLEAAKRAAEQRLTVICLGVGTQSGGVIPDPASPGGYYRDQDGKVVTTRLQRDVLVRIANLTGGLYLPLDGPGVNDARIELILQKLDRSAAMKGKTIRKSLDRYRWPLGAGLGLLLASFLAGISRRHRAAPAGASSLATAAALALVLLGRSETASAQTGPAAEPVGNPWKYYQAGAWDAAVSNFDRVLKLADESEAPAVQFAKGAAAFRKKDFDSAISAFGAATLSPDWKQRADAHYNLANSIYEKARDLAATAKPKQLMKLSFLDGLIRQLENSLENYQQAMLNPGNRDAVTNHDITDKLIAKLREIREQVARQSGKGKGKKGKKGEDPGEEGEGDGEGEGEGNGKGKGKGNGKGKKNKGDSEDGEEEGEGSGGKQESEKERAAREKSNQEREGKVGTEGDNGEKGEGDNGEDGKGEKGAKGEADGDGDGEPDENSEAEASDDEMDPATGFSRGEARRQLDRLSDEDFSVRPQVENSYEVSPAKDW